MRAEKLYDVYKTVSPEPLRTKDDLDALYVKEVNDLRGEDTIFRLARLLDRPSANFHKYFLSGHPGVGKTTELSRLIENIRHEFQVIRFNALSDINPIVFQPFDIILLMMIEVVEQTAKPIADGGAGAKPPDDILEALERWFATETVKWKTESGWSISGEAGVGPSADSLWAKALGLFGKVKGEAKYAAGRTTEITEYRLIRLGELVQLANRVLLECERLLNTNAGRQWLFIWDNFEKAGVSLGQLERLFLSHGNVLKELKANLIFTLPTSFFYAKSNQLQFPGYILTDTPVYDANHQPHDKGRAVLEKILDLRVAPNLFEPSIKQRLIVASGGNPRNLFYLVFEASETALDRSLETIDDACAQKAIIKLRTEYSRALGDDPTLPVRIPYEDKAKRLVSVYNGEKQSEHPDPILNTLLYARAVQEFNGERWFGVHPLVVDILKAEGHILPQANGEVLGGSI